MRFSAKKIGSRLGALAAKDPEAVKAAVKEIAAFVVQSGKTSKLGDLIRYFSKSYNKESGSIDVIVTASDKESLPAIKTIAGKKAVVKEVIDSKLLGGLKIEAEDIVIDASIKGKIDMLRQTV